MRLSPGARLGPHEIKGPLGAGGMGEVYRALDLRLGREVAIKVLPASAAGDPDRLRRLEQEARTTGALNHPNVIAVFEIGTHEGVPYVVTELLDGETLQALLAEGPLPPRKVVDYAMQVASGLAAAHEKGIVHRDLKPDNVFVTRDGLVKILDFGLAKVQPAVDQPVTANQKTLEGGTEPGTVMGTAGYMSPEQVRGQPVDQRSDVFALGAILYEMLAGERAFKSATPVETLHAILKEDPPEIEGTRGVPPALERVMRRCLEKQPAERFQSARDVGFALEAVSLASTTGVTPALESSKRLRHWPWWLVAAAAGGALFAAGILIGSRPRGETLPTYTQVTFRRGLLASARFAPDGQTVVYSARWEGPGFETFSARPGSPESRALGLPEGFVSSISPAGEMAYLLGRTAVLARAPLAGGEPRSIAEDVEEADWAPDGSLAVARSSKGGNVRIEYPIGKVLYESPYGLQSPSVSPSGERVAFYESLEARGTGSVVVVDRAGTKTVLGRGFRSVRDAYTSVKMQGLRWSPSGDEVWVTAKDASGSTALHALTLAGRDRVIARFPGTVVLRDVAKDGRVLLSREVVRAETRGRGPDATAERDLSWLDGSWVLDLSPDGRSLLFNEQGEGGGPERAIYLRGTDGSPAVRLGEGTGAALSPDGKWALSLDSSKTGEIRILPTGPGEARSVRVEGVSDLGAVTWLPDGLGLLVTATEPGRPWRVYRIGLAGGRPQPVTPEGSIFVWSSKPVSPDGRWFFALSYELGYRLFPVDGGESREIPGLDRNVREVPVRWTADGRSVFVWRSGFPPSLDRLDVASGRREPWRRLEPPDMVGVSWLPWALPTPDGRAYVYSYRRTLSDLYVIEGLK